MLHDYITHNVILIKFIAVSLFIAKRYKQQQQNKAVKKKEQKKWENNIKDETNLSKIKQNLSNDIYSLCRQD